MVVYHFYSILLLRQWFIVFHKLHYTKWGFICSNVVFVSDILFCWRYWIVFLLFIFQKVMIYLVFLNIVVDNYVSTFQMVFYSISQVIWFKQYQLFFYCSNMMVITTILLFRQYIIILRFLYCSNLIPIDVLMLWKNNEDTQPLVILSSQSTVGRDLFQFLSLVKVLHIVNSYIILLLDITMNYSNVTFLFWYSWYYLTHAAACHYIDWYNIINNIWKR